MKAIIVLATMAVAAHCQLNLMTFVKNLRPLSGSGLLASVEQDCEVPVKELGQCLSGQRGADHRLGKLYLRKSQGKLKALKRHPEVQALIGIGKDVEQCFQSNGCELQPMGAVKCLLDYIIYGGPYDRAAQCILDSWGLRSSIKTPEFGDLSALEDTVKLFAGIGLYKDLNKDREDFWSRYSAKLQVYCPARNVASVQSCIDDAAFQPGEGRLRLDLGQMSYDAKKARWDGRCRGDRRKPGCANPPAPTRLPPALEAVDLSVFGERSDIKFVKEVLLDRVLGCGIDLVVHRNNLPYAQRRSVNRVSKSEIVGKFLSNDVCDMPKCIQYLWTVKDSLCSECRGEIFPGTDPFGRGDDGFKCFAAAASAEFIAVVAGQPSRRDKQSIAACNARSSDTCGASSNGVAPSSAYQCRIPSPSGLCSSCSSAAGRWRRDCVDPLAGYEKEAAFVINLLKTVCKFGSGAQKITASQCPNYL